MKLLCLYWGIMILCYLAASRLRKYREKFGFLDRMLTGFIVFMVFIMGLQMGADEDVVSSLGTIGVQSALITAVSVGGSILAVSLGRKIFSLDRHGMPKRMPEAGSADERGVKNGGADERGVKNSGAEDTGDGNRGELTMTLLILSFVAIGMLCGYFAVPKLFENNMETFEALCGDLLVAGLCILLGIIGFNMGLTGEMVRNLRGAGLSALVIPLFAVGGSLVGGAFYGLFSPLTVREGIAVSAGFGWYTLAPGLITEAGHTVAGAVSFMHNVMREVLGIIGIPLFAKYIGYLEAAAVPGVAAMDVCIPIVERSTRQEILVYSFITGFFMCIAVPIIVPLAIG